MNELLVGEIVHAITNLSREVEKEFWQIHREIWNPEKEMEGRREGGREGGGERERE